MKLQYVCYWALIVVVLSLYGACTEPVEPPMPELLPCNGHPELCDRAYNEVAYATTHNGNSYAPVYHFWAANHNYPVGQQLEDGVRALMIDAYDSSCVDSLCGLSEVCVYHGFPGLGCEPIEMITTPVREFLLANPREVITLIMDAGANPHNLAMALEAANLTQYMHSQNLGEPWPTLQNLIDSGKRLVVFSSQNATVPAPNIHYFWDFTVDTDYQAESRFDFACDYFRGAANNDLFLINHFITINVPQPDSAAAINSNPYLLERVNTCINEHNRIANFLAVDFYSFGDVLATVDSINGVK